MNHDDALHLGFDITADDQESKELLNFIKEFDKENGGVEFQVVNSLTTRIDFEGDRTSADGIKERLENMKALRQALFDKYGAENVQDLDLYNDISRRISELEDAYSEYDTALDEYNNTAAKAQIIQSLVGKEIPQTVDGYKRYRQELIKSAQASDQYIGSQEDITNAIDGTLTEMSEFEDIRKRADNIDTAYSLFGIDNNVNSASEGMKKAFVDSLSDDELSVLVQLDKSEFDKGIDNVKQAIGDFNSGSDNGNIEIETEADTSGLEDLKKAYENVSKSADSFIKNQKSLKSALEEQEKHGQLSASTIRELSEAGYSEALVTDKVTGAVTLDMQAYEKLNAQKQEKIRLDLENEKNDLEEKLRDEQSAVSDLKQEYEVLAKADMEAIEDIRGLISQINGDITSLAAPSFDNDSTDKNKEAFDKLYSQWNHDLEMNKVTQDEYINWLDGAYKQYFSDLTKYQNEYNRYEEEVYKYRTDREQKLFDKKIDNLEKLADKALDNYKDGDGNELTVTASFDYAREQINSAITETQARIDGIRNGTIIGDADDIEELTESLDQLNEKLTDIDQKEIDSEKSYIDAFKDDYSDMMDERIKAVEKLSDAIEKSYENEINAIDKKIKAIDKQREAEDRKRKILEAQKKVKEAEKELNKAGIKKYIVLTNNGWEAQADNTDIEEAQQNLDEAKQDLEDALKDEQKAILEDQKDILEEQRDNAKDYYSTQKEALETQKEYQEDVCDTLSDILDKIGGDTEQTESNRALIDNLTKSGDINAAVSRLSEIEKQKALESGLITKTDGGFELNYSALDKMTDSLNTAFADSTKAINDLAATVSESNDIHKTENNVEQSTDTVTAGGFNLVADEKTGKLTKKPVTINGEPVEGLGHKVNPTTKAEWEERHNKSEWSNNIIPFSEIDLTKIEDDNLRRFYELLNKIQLNNIPISTPTIPPVKKNMDEIMNISTNNSPAFNCTINIDGSADEKTVEKFRNVCESEINQYFQYLNNTMSTAFLKQRNKI